MIFRKSIFSLLIIILVLSTGPCLFPRALDAGDPAQLDFQESNPEAIVVSLDGTWSFTPSGMQAKPIQVPGWYVWKRERQRYYLENAETGPWLFVEHKPEGYYEHTFQIPSSMAGKKIFIHFEAVNYLVDLFINGHSIGSHGGGDVPFEVDITSHVTAPSSATLRINIRYWNSLVDANERSLWPIGWYGQYWHVGVVDHVYLIAREPVFIENIYVKTSVRDQKIRCLVTVKNTESAQRTVTLSGRVKEGGSTVLTLNNQDITVNARSSKTCTFEKSWTNPKLWRPGSPSLYHWVSELFQSGQKKDESSVRFGFREFWHSGKNYYLNGTRVNLRGDNVSAHVMNNYMLYFYPNPSLWSASIDSMLGLNFNTIRMHSQPAPEWMINVCDEKGILVIYESAVFELEVSPVNNTDYIENSKTYLKELVHEYRNHPSIVIWSPENEMLMWKKFTAEAILSWGSAVLSVDDTRPLIYEGDNDLNGLADTYSKHYIYGAPTGWPTVSIYQMRNKMHASKPSSYSEFDNYTPAITGSERVRRQCVQVRAARIVNIADVRPYRLDWSWHPDPGFSPEKYGGFIPSQDEIKFLKNSMDPLAVFDKAYYEFERFPAPPSFNEAQTVTRTIAIFNDDLSGETVEVKWEVIIQDNTVQNGTFTENITPGNHIEKTLEFQAPYVKSKTFFDLRLMAYKSGRKRFEENVRFESKDIGLNPPASPRAVQTFSISRSQNQLTLSWTPVQYNLDGKPVTIESYVINKSTDISFPVSKTDSIVVQTGTQYVDHPQTLDNPAANTFYRIKAKSSGQLYSAWSSVVGEFDYSLVKTSTTSYNQIAFPLRVSGVSNAQTLMSIIPGCNGVAYWNASEQGYIQYIPSVPSTNFTVSMGNPYYVHVNANGLFSMTGEVVRLQFQLTPTSTTSFNEIVLPLHYGHIKLASQLMSNISNCNGVARWNASIQGYEQYVPGIPSTNFSVTPGKIYYVNITYHSTWPPAGSGKSEIVPAISLKNVSRQVPHVAWGRLTGNMAGQEKLRLRAFLFSNPAEILDENNAGCAISEDHWMIQCASFPSGWEPGGSLFVELYRDGKIAGKTEVVLSSDPADASDIVITDSLLPLTYQLSNAYPNPFNSETHIQYSLPESGRITILVLNTLGQTIRKLFSHHQDAGHYHIIWNGRNDHDEEAESGLYLIQMTAGRFSAVQKVLLVR